MSRARKDEQTERDTRRSVFGDLVKQYGRKQAGTIMAQRDRYKERKRKKRTKSDVIAAHVNK